jgi:hypothetical protein
VLAAHAGDFAMHPDLSIGPRRAGGSPSAGIIDPPRLWFLLHVGRIAAAALLFYAAVWLAAVVVLWGSESSLVFETGLSRQFTAPLDRRIFEPVALPAPDGLMLEGVVLAHADVAAAAYSYLTRQRGVPATRVILAGRSLGSAVAVELATRVDAAGVLMFSAIDSVPRTAGRLFPYVPAAFLTRNRFDSCNKVPTLHIPIVMIHVVDDELVPVSTARTMFREIRAPKKFVETDGGHHDAGFTIAAKLGAALATFWPVGLGNEKSRGP